MEAIILAGGFGTRLQKIVKDVPKPMAPVNSKPFLEILLEHCLKNGISRVVFSVGYLSEQIISYFGSRYKDIEIEYSIEKEPLGTGGAVLQSMKLILAESFFILNGDTYLDVNYKDVAQYYCLYGNPIIVGCQVNDASRYGSLKLDENNNVIGFGEKSKVGHGIINAGCYYFPKSIFEGTIIKNQKFALEKEFLMDYVQHNEVSCYLFKGKFIDIGVPEDYFQAQQMLL